jgi:hypothetical protein
MVSYAQQLKPEDSDEQLLSWINLPITQRLFAVYFQQVDWSRYYYPQHKLQGQLSMIITAELGMDYWHEKQAQLASHAKQPIKMITTEGQHVTMVRSPYVSRLAVKLNQLLSA